MAPIANTSVFGFAQTTSPSLFAGTPTAGQTTYQGRQYDYRYYPSTGNYLAVDSDGVVSMLGNATGNALVAVAPVESFRSQITGWEAGEAARSGNTCPGTTAATPATGTTAAAGTTAATGATATAG